jgi:hypothetical protein
MKAISEKQEMKSRYSNPDFDQYNWPARSQNAFSTVVLYLLVFTIYLCFALPAALLRSFCRGLTSTFCLSSQVFGNRNFCNFHFI